jgi:hypothetical protein
LYKSNIEENTIVNFYLKKNPSWNQFDIEDFPEDIENDEYKSKNLINFY